MCGTIAGCTERWGASIHLMTTSEKKTTQTSRGKRKDRTDEYNFFVSSDENGSDQEVIGQSGTKESSKNGIIKLKQSSNFFLPE
jgi:hypothetical protein